MKASRTAYIPPITAIVTPATSLWARRIGCDTEIWNRTSPKTDSATEIPTTAPIASVVGNSTIQLFNAANMRNLDDPWTRFLDAGQDHSGHGIAHVITMIHEGLGTRTISYFPAQNSCFREMAYGGGKGKSPPGG